MRATNITYPAEKKGLYRLLTTQLQGLTDGVSDLTANLANVSALLNQALTDINWVGFYLMKDGCLILGPFQGKPACVEIQVGSGAFHLFLYLCNKFAKFFLTHGFRIFVKFLFFFGNFFGNAD